MAADRATMASGSQQRRALRRELFDAIVTLAMTGGGMTGFAWAMQRPEPEPPATCSNAGTTTGGIGDCFADSLLASLMPYLAGATLGAIACGLLATLLLRALFGSRRGGAGRQRPPGRWVTARYHGRCSGCSTSISPGDRIRHSPRRSLCGACAKQRAA